MQLNLGGEIPANFNVVKVEVAVDMPGRKNAMLELGAVFMWERPQGITRLSRLTLARRRNWRCSAGWWR